MQGFERRRTDTAARAGADVGGRVELPAWLPNKLFVSGLKLTTPALAALLIAPTGCADDTPPVAAAEESSSSGSADVDGRPPMETTATATATDGPSGSTGGSTAGPVTSEGSETGKPGTSESDEGTTASLPGSTGGSSDDGTTDDGTTGATSTGEASTSDGTTDDGTTGAASTGGASTDGGSSDGGSSDGGSSGGGSSDGSSSGGGSSDGGSSDGGSSGGSTGSGSELDKFESPEPFGDQVAETDLIGTWTLPTDGTFPNYTMKFTVGADGTFDWIEYNEFCEPSRQGNGWLWISGPAMVMLWENFTDAAPWDVMGHFGWDAEAPFLTRSGYFPAIGHLAITFPDAMRVAAPWGSRGFVRTVGGATIEDTWVAETELWDVWPDDAAASIVARKRYTLAIGGGDAWETINHWWFENGEQTADPTEYYLYPYTDELNGYGTVNTEDYLYLGSGMMTFEPGENFLLDGPKPCEG